MGQATAISTCVCTVYAFQTEVESDGDMLRFPNSLIESRPHVTIASVCPKIWSCVDHTSHALMTRLAVAGLLTA